MARWHDRGFPLTGEPEVRLAALIPQPGRPTIRYSGSFAPNAKLRAQVVQAGTLAPRRRDKPQPGGHGCQMALTYAALAHHAALQSRQDSGRLALSVGLRVAWKADVLQCPCAGRRRLVAVIAQAVVLRRILAHGGLATEALTKPEDPVWVPKKSTLCGPPHELFPGDLDAAGLSVEVDGVDEEPGEPFLDEPPAEDWAA